MAWIMTPIVRFRGGENETVRPRELSVSRGFFSAMGIRWIAGRDFSEEEMDGDFHSVIVNQAFVDKFLRGLQPIGQTFTTLTDAPDPQTQQIIGVVGNFRYNNIRELVILEILLSAGLVDEWILYLAPKLLGPQAKPLAAFARLTKMAAAPQFELLDSATVGTDMRLRLRLRPRSRPGTRK